MFATLFLFFFFSGFNDLFSDINIEFEAKKSKIGKDSGKKSSKPKAPQIIKDGKRVQNISIMMAGLSKQGTRSLSQIAECVQNLNSKDGPFQLNAEEIEGLMKAVRCWLSSFYFFYLFFFVVTLFFFL